jgi:uncharacterized protein YjeT (DUF2065 family)
MPLTFSHPAAVIPLVRRGLVFSALVVGSMSPDFEFFLRLSANYHFGHTLPGLFLFSVPAGLVVLWIFHALLKWPLLSLFPISHQQRLMPLANDFSFGPIRRFGLILLSLLIGVVIHVAWDSFTHLDGWTVQHVAFLNQVVWKTSFGGIQLCRILQHISTLFGLIVLAVSYWHWLRRTPRAEFGLPPQLSPRTKIRVVFYIGFAALLLGCGYAYLLRHPVLNVLAVQLFYIRVIIVSISTTFVELILFGLWWQAFYGQSWRVVRARYW